MKERLRNLSVRLMALVTSVVLVLVCTLSTGIIVDAAVADPYANVDFETYLTQQGFPESYKVKLRELHQKYPYWKFEAQQTGMDWNDVIQAESKLGLNLTENSNPSSWKSTQEGAYDWDTGSWIELDSGYWVAASSEIISYYMDPRNVLDETYIFQFLKQSYDADLQNLEGVQAVVNGTFLSGTYNENGQISYADTLLRAAKESGVSPYTLASMIIIEQGVNGQGKCISGNVAGYEGYYNYFNIGAYKTSTMSAVERGLWYAKGSGSNATTYSRPWNTRTKAIVGGAVYYGSNYIAKGQDTLYLKKFNVQGSHPFTHQYMTNVRGASLEAAKMSKAYTGTARTANLTFRIPVYENMPETACVKPTDNSVPVKETIEEPTIPEEPKTPEEPTIPEEPTTPTENSTIDGDVSVSDATGNVGEQVTVNAIITVPDQVVSAEKLVLSYDSNKLALVEQDGVTGGAGSAVIDKSEMQANGTVSTPVTFQILAEGSHEVAVSSYEVVTPDEEMLTLAKTTATVTGNEQQKAVAVQNSAKTGGSTVNNNNSPVQKQNNSAVSEEIASVPENTETEEEAVASKPVIRNADSESTTKKQNTVDASKYDNKEAAVASAVTGSVKKQIFIILSCVALAGISAGAAYFLKGFGRK